MTAHPRQQRLHAGRREQVRRAATARRQRQPRPAPIDPGTILTAEQLDELWAAFAANRADRRLRDRLVLHYLPWVRDLAGSIAHTMGLADRENAIAEAVAALVASIVPGYDGHSGFERWARVCIRRRLIDLRREEQRDRTMFVAVPPRPVGSSILDLLPDRQERGGGDLAFLDFTADLNDRQSLVLWLRLYRGMSVKAVAALLKISPCSVKVCMHAAVAELRKTWAGYPWEWLRSYL